MDMGYFYGGARPLGQAPPQAPVYPLQSDDPRAITDYLLTSFEEHKMVTGQRLQELESKLAHVTAELDELKEITRREQT